MPRHALLPAALLVLALAAPAGAAADDVSVTRQGTELVVRLTGAAAAAASPYVGKELTISCEDDVAPGLLLSGGSGAGQTGSSAVVRRDADGSLILRTYFADRAYDVCEVGRPLVRRKLGQQGPFAIFAGDRGPAIGRVALTPAGATWLDELAHAVAMDRTSRAALAQRSPGYPQPTAFSAPGVVALTGPDGTPPAGSVGYWSDGAGHVAFVALSGAGRRLIGEDLGDGMTRSNVGRFTDQLAAEASTPSFQLATKAVDRDSGPSPLRHRRGTSSPDELLPATARSSLSGTRLTLRFTGKGLTALRRLAGRRVSVACGPAALPAAPRTGRDYIADYQLVAARVPRRGAVLRVALQAGKGADVCALADDGHGFAIATPTKAGRDLMTDLTYGGQLFELADLAPGTATAYPAAAAIVAKHPKVLVALSGPDAFPPPGRRVGVWTAGDRAVLAATSPTGHHLVMADEGNGVLRDNVELLLLQGLLLTLS